MKEDMEDAKSTANIQKFNLEEKHALLKYQLELERVHGVLRKAAREGSPVKVKSPAKEVVSDPITFCCSPPYVHSNPSFCASICSTKLLGLR